jgi:protein JBTS26
LQQSYTQLRPSPTKDEIIAPTHAIEASPPHIEPAKIITGNISLANKANALSTTYELKDTVVMKEDVLKSDGEYIAGSRVSLVILSTWGDLEFCGLTGVEILVSSDLKAAKLSKSDISADPYGLVDIGYEHDIRTPDKLINGLNNTTCEDNMWLFPFTPKGRHIVEFNLNREVKIYGLRIWNYNKSVEIAKTRGAKCISVLVDNSEVCRTQLRMVRLFIVYSLAA